MSIINIAVFGESRVGKTCFTNTFLYGKHNTSRGNPFETPKRHLADDYDGINVYPMDLSSTTFRDASLSRGNQTLDSQFFIAQLQKASGIVLIYDITELATFKRVTDMAYTWLCICKRFLKDASVWSSNESFGCVLVGNKADLVRGGLAERKVDRTVAEEWAHSQGIIHMEVDSNNREEVDAAVWCLIKDYSKKRRRSLHDLSERAKQQEAKDTQNKRDDYEAKTANTWRGKLRSAFASSKSSS